jgi:hypothetical protein
MLGRICAVCAVVFGLVFPASGHASASSDTTGSQCGFSSVLTVFGNDGGDRVASYAVRASWCVDRQVTTTSVKTADAKDRRGSAKAARKRHRHRKINGGGGGGGGQSSQTVTTCITNFQMSTQATPMASGVVFRNESVTPTTGDSCTTRAFRIQGKFFTDYVDGVPSSLVTRDSSSADVPETNERVEIYPAGRVGPFDISVTFTSDGTGFCSGCTTDFNFCDARLYNAASSSKQTGCLNV